MGTELQACDLDASADGTAKLFEWRRGVASGRWLRVACGCRAYRGGGAVHIDRHHAHEPQALGARPRSRFRRDSHAAGALGPSPCGPDDAERAGHDAVHLVAPWRLTSRAADTTHHRPLAAVSKGRLVDEDLEAMTREQLMAEARRLRAGIRAHRDSTGHALCWHHPALWGLLPEKTDTLPKVPTWPEFLRGCLRYRQSLDEQLPDAPRSDVPYQP